MRSVSPGDELNNISVSAGIQASGSFGIKGIFALDVDVNVGRAEISLVDGESGFRSSYAFALGVGKYKVGLSADKYAHSRDFFRNGASWEVAPFLSAGNAKLNDDFVLDIGGAFFGGFDAQINMSQLWREIKK